MESGYTHFQCPICGRNVGIKGYDPSNFEVDVLGLSFVGLGRGRGFDVSKKESLLDTGDSVLELISDRLAEVYDLFYGTDEVEELTDEINEALGADYATLFDAAMDLLSRYQDYQEEEEDEEEESMDSIVLDEEEDEDEKPLIVEEEEEEPLSELDREILIAEREE